MSLVIQKEYANLISSRLESFKWRSANIANFRCPFCGDSDKDKTKSRGYLYVNGGTSMNFHCHNCGRHYKSFKNFLAHIDSEMAKEYAFEAFKFNNSSSSARGKKKEQEKQIEQLKENFKAKKKDYRIYLGDLTCIRDLDDDHSAVRELKRRHMYDFADLLYYTDNYKKWINDNIIPDKFNNTRLPDPRIVFVYKDTDNRVFAFSGRSLLEDCKIRYLHVNPEHDLGTPMIYGIDHVDFTQRVFVYEGQFDSLVTPNSIAASGASGMRKLLTSEHKSSMVFVFDNEPRNPDICKMMKNVINLGGRITIFNSNYKFNDVNDLLLQGYTRQNVVDLLNKHTFQGLRASLEFARWNKS